MNFRFLILTFVGIVTIIPVYAAKQEIEADVCIYGATASGILAAIAVEREGKTPIIVEPGRWVGGMLGAGIKPLQDCANFAAVGGMTRGLLQTLGTPEPIPELPINEMRKIGRNIRPQDVRNDLLELLQKHQIKILYNHRISACELRKHRIRTARFDLAPFDEYGCPPAIAQKPNHLEVSADLFIDASYEGSLMLHAGVSFRTGRESSQAFDEHMAGVREPDLLTPIDPYIDPGNPESGLLPLLVIDHGKPLGAADHFTQAYNYRYYVTADPQHRAPILPSDDYSPTQYELVGRYIEYLVATIKDEQELTTRLGRIFPGWMNSGEYNYHRESLITMAPLGISQDYANGNYAEKSKVWNQHRDYLRGLHYFISTDPRVPTPFRNQTAQLGLDRRVHPQTNGWPHQLYVRVSRRLQGRYTITAHDVYNRTQVNDSIGLAQYGLDTYPSRRIGLKRADQNYVALEGKMFIGGSKGPTNVPYPIPYRSITPKTEECTNLLVPVCFSASHLGYASARMEPVFMICGESAGVAAVQALQENCAVQDINLQRYLARLDSLGQKRIWTSNNR